MIGDENKLQAFCMAANLYFIGSEAVSVHLLDTTKGLVLIDTGYPDMGELIINNIVKLGFLPENICAIFHSHGHIDHYGTTRQLVQLSGAKTYISRIDNDIVNGTFDLSWAKELKLPPIPPFSCDVLVEDGETFDFGNTTIRCVHTPGHTAGVMSFIITLPDGTVAAMHGGVGFNSMKSSFLRAYSLSFACRAQFKEGLRKLAGEKVDLVLGNHPQQNNTLEKMQRIFRGEKDICDTGEWVRFLREMDVSMDRLMQNDPEINS